MMEVGQLVSDWLSAEDIRPHLERGDLVEFRRTMRIGRAKRRVYTHWAVYIGIMDEEPRVVHISNDDGDFEGVTGEGKIRDSIAGFGKIMEGSRAEVRCDVLGAVAGDDLVRVNNSLDSSHRPFPPTIVVERATHKMGDGNYNLMSNNCEHFVKWCRYGNRISSQAVAAKSVMLTSVLAVGIHPLVAVGAGLLFAATSNRFSRAISSTFGTNYSFY